MQDDNRNTGNANIRADELPIKCTHVTLGLYWSSGAVKMTFQMTD